MLGLYLFLKRNKKKNVDLLVSPLKLLRFWLLIEIELKKNKEKKKLDKTMKHVIQPRRKVKSVQYALGGTRIHFCSEV